VLTNLTADLKSKFLNWKFWSIRIDWNWE
jgi:hypothetical protein